ncbi:MAG: fibrinogen-binding protein, partial [Planctomycetota bacterium]
MGFIDGIDTFGSLGGVAINPTPGGSPQVFQTATQSTVDRFADQFGNDVILLINLGTGQNSVENNFSEVTTTSLPIPPEPPTPPVTPPPVAPPAGVFTPAALPPVTPPPPTEYPIYGGSSQSLGWTWHLSVINAGQPRAIAMTGDGAARFTSTSTGADAWRDAKMDRAEWTLIDDDQDAGELHEFVFGNENAIPVAGDWNGDGVTDIGVFIEGYWYLDLNGNGRWDAGDLWAHLGSEADLPVTGDWDADGKDDIGIFGPAWPRDPHAIARDPGLPDAENFPTRLAYEDGHLKAKNVPPTEEDATSGARILRRTIRGDGRADRIDHVFHYGTPGDAPIAGDWNGDGVRTIGVYRDGVWTLDTDGDGRLTERDESFA